MKQFKKVIALFLVVLMSVSLFPVMGAAEESVQNAKAEHVVEKVESSLGIVEEVFARLRNAFLSFKCMLQRINGSPATIDAMYEMDFQLAQNGETVSLSHDIVCPEVKIDKAINLNLNGYSITCNSFTYTSDKAAKITVMNGVIDAKGGGNVRFSVPNATLNLSDVTVKLASESSQFYVDASMHTLNINSNVKVVYTDAETLSEKSGTITVGGDTRVRIAQTANHPVTLVISGDNVVVENASTAVQNSKSADGSENPNGGMSILSISVLDAGVDSVTVKNVSDGEIPEMNIVVPENYENHIDVDENADVVVKTRSGEDSTDNVREGKMDTPDGLTAIAANGPSAKISGLNPAVQYEYRACYAKTYTSIADGSETFTTTEKHIYLRAKATDKRFASDETEIATGASDEAGLYTIGCTDELRAFSQSASDGNVYKNQTVYLMGDVDLGNEEWTPIGSKTYQFAGTFDGQGHSISNLKVTRGLENEAANNGIGLFSYLGASAEVKNLVIDNADLSGSLNVGVIAGYTTSGSVIRDVKLTGTISVYGWWYCGGITGKGYPKMYNCDIEADETSKIEITGGYAGGLVGHVEATSAVYITDCDSNIDVYGEYNGVGGLTGILQYNNIIENCTCSGNVYMMSGSPEEIAPAGGICGSYSSTVKSAKIIYPIMLDCTFTGTIYHKTEVHANMAHPLYGAPRFGTDSIIVDHVIINP